MTNPPYNTNRPEPDSTLHRQVDKASVCFAQPAADSPDSDLPLVLRVQSGDTAAFGELIEKHQHAVYGVISRMMQNRDDADDLVQDVFVSAYRAIGGFRRDAKFSTWLHTIAVNTTLKRLKSMKNKAAISLDDPDTGLYATMQADDGPSPLESAQNRERDEAVRKAIDTLPDKHKIVVVMHYFEHHSCAEIASILGCSEGTIWSRLHYACRKLKGELRWLQQGL